MSLFLTILIALAALVFIPLAFDWSRELRRRKALGGLGTRDNSSAYLAGGTDILPGLSGYQSHDGSFAGACDSAGSEFGDCGGGDGGGGGGGGGGGD